MIPKEPFRRFVREIIQDYKADVRVSEDAFNLIQELAENYLVGLLSEALLTALHAGRIIIYPKDLQLEEFAENALRIYIFYMQK